MKQKHSESPVVQRVSLAQVAIIGALNGRMHAGHQGELVRDGIQVAIIGAPNAGKSSLLNFLSQRYASLSSALTAGWLLMSVQGHGTSLFAKR